MMKFLRDDPMFAMIVVLIGLPLVSILLMGTVIEAADAFEHYVDVRYSTCREGT